MEVILIVAAVVAAVVWWDRYQARQPLDLGEKTWRTPTERADAIDETDQRWRVPTGWTTARPGGVTTREVEAAATAAIVARRNARVQAMAAPPGPHVRPFRKVG